MRKLRALFGASFILWLPLAALTVALTGAVYSMVQQDYRSSANDPQMQMATDARLALENGVAPHSVIPAQTVDMAASLAPYLIIYDDQGAVVASSVTLHGQTPQLPAGVLASAKQSSPDILTWQPESGVRSAIVVMPYANGFVVAGRSLAAVEQRERNLELQALAGAAGTLLVTYGAVVVSRWLAQRYHL